MHLQRIFFHLIRISIFLFLAFKIGLTQNPQEFVSKDIPKISANNQNDYVDQVNFNFCNKKSFNGFSSDHVIYSITNINYYWWMIISGEKSSEMKKKLLYQLEVTKQEFIDDKNDLALLFLLSFDLRVHFYYNELISAFFCLKKINQKLAESEQNQGSLNNEYFLVVKSLVNYINAHINDKYPFYYKLLIHKPCVDKINSIDQLKKLTRSKNNIVSTESNYFLMKIFFDNEHDFQSAEIYARTLTVNYPGNYIFSFYFTSTLIKNKNLNQAQIEKERTLNNIANNDYLSENQNNYCKLLFQNLLNK